MYVDRENVEIQLTRIQIHENLPGKTRKSFVTIIQGQSLQDSVQSCLHYKQSHIGTRDYWLGTVCCKALFIPQIKGTLLFQNVLYIFIIDFNGGGAGGG